MDRFADRRHAGAVLADRLSHLDGRDDVVVLALPRGGVPVAHQVARRLGAPLDVFVVRKLGVPGHEELAFGAVASGGALVLNDDVVAAAHLDADVREKVARREREELARRELAYRGDQPFPALRDHTVVLVDDGLATGASMRAAVEGVRAHRPTEVIVAVPVGAPESCHELAAVADEVVCVSQPFGFGGVGRWYENFDQTTDDEVRETLLGVG